MPNTKGIPTPLFLLNLKAYSGTFGQDALALGKMLSEVGQEYSVSVALAPSTPFISSLARELDIPVLAQHTDPGAAGARTGRTLAAALKEAGAQGSLVNHSEYPISAQDAKSTVAVLEEFGLIPVVCAGTSEASGHLAGLCKPRFIAVEPPELIGGNVSVSVQRPEVVSGAVGSVKRVSPSTHVLCGAGVKDRKDVSKALELGAEGVLVASAVATAKDPRGALEELLKGF